eukprot:scaffold7340_cov266-Pinguiococcus_pyrenoidosus.AAC.83
MGSSCCRLAGSMLPTWPVPPAIRSDPSSLLHAGRPKLVLARCQSGALPAPSRDKGSKAAFSHFPSSAKRRICSGVRDAHKSPGSILLSPMLCSSLSDLRLFQSFFLEALPDFFVLFSEFPEVWNSRLALPLTCACAAEVLDDGRRVNFSLFRWPTHLSHEPHKLLGHHLAATLAQVLMEEIHGCILLHEHQGPNTSQRSASAPGGCHAPVNLCEYLAQDLPLRILLQARGELARRQHLCALLPALARSIPNGSFCFPLTFRFPGVLEPLLDVWLVPLEFLNLPFAIVVIAVVYRVGFPFPRSFVHHVIHSVLGEGEDGLRSYGGKPRAGRVPLADVEDVDGLEVQQKLIEGAAVVLQQIV